MRGELDLNGRRIRVVEDEYFLAADAEWALRGVAAQVAGPCSSERRRTQSSGRVDLPPRWST